MKQVISLFFLLCVLRPALCQNFNLHRRYDSLLREKQLINTDTNKINIWNGLANIFKFSRPDSSVYYGSKALEFSRSISFHEGEVNALEILGIAYSTIGNNASSLKINLEGLKKAEQFRLKDSQSAFLLSLADNYRSSADYEKALSYYQRAYILFDSLQNYRFSAICSSYIGQTYFALGKVDSAFFYCYKGKHQGDRLDVNWVIGQTHTRLGEIHRDLGNLDSAFCYFQKAVHKSALLVEGSGHSYRALELAKLFESFGQQDSCLYYAGQALEIGSRNKLYEDTADACTFLSDYYEKSDAARALHFNKMALAYKDSITNISRIASFTDMIDFDEQQRNFELEVAKNEYQSTIRMNILIGSTFTLLITAFFLFRNNRNKQKAKQAIEQAFEQLKSTQSQLIQSEKMASLGELTAGIAHEIQNPLNFVNNFSQVNRELVEELKEAVSKNDQEEINALLKDLGDNEEKVTHHGKRADAIVKGMLQHSRSSTGTKEPTDINALVDEYLRLSYHGLRAKDKSFNATIETNYDAAIGNINIIPQDIGRVVLNLINNAFYAVAEASAKETALSAKALAAADAGYQPTVSVSTKKSGNQVTISIKDNGSGIPDAIKDKIFQPFFTTKPTGQGTGLGLSLSYDIVKAHGGKIDLEPSRDEYTTMNIKLPIKQ